ncbi:molecular chaperone DnaJ/Hsp40 [Bodo saltans virus]|uniref:Molecular chaperone DnaJ/Hsp40 n=1 Tax=Bodo saltans virus TaxID=2024608 RepID=A0A2H4UUB5_9VIRU|nr:molecular chaperone DnaJ/Hsp40 [Bodo saltans virus]ATZ80415.1 molecular chaperone DnaJ/Hsp40 [Bodo saltans virus]
MKNKCYKILNIKEGSTYTEIKSAYKKLALKYHPDKFDGNNEKFIEVHKAYKCLTKNDNNSDDSDELINYNDKYNEYNNNLNNLFQQIKKWTIPFLNSFILQNKKSDIVCTITCKLIDRYNDKYMKLEIERKTRDNFFVYIPLKKDTHVFLNEGEISGNNAGNIVIKTKTIECGDYYIKNSNMYKKIIVDKIPDVYSFIHIDDKNYNIKKEDIIYDKFAIIENIGLLNENNIRGDLLCEFQFNS